MTARRRKAPSQHAERPDLDGGPIYPSIFWKAMNLPRMYAEYRFAPPRRWRFDFADTVRLIALEIEGGAWTGGRHTRAPGFIKDMEKYNEAAIRGWRILRVTPQQMNSGEAAELVRRILDGAE